MKMRIRGERILHALSREAWAIMPDKLEEIAAFLTLRANGGEVSAQEIQAIVGARTERTESRGSGIAVIPLTGTILHRATSMEESSGVVSMERWKRAFGALVNDPSIGTIIIHIDSPGGAVGGTPEVAQLVYEAREQKHIIALADSLMASAAYYIGAAATEVVAVPSSIVGSIGVLSMHADMSRYHEKLGVKVSIIRYGEHKAEANPFEPLTDTAREHLQETVDTYGEMFIRDVARFRGIKPSVVREQFGSGRVFNSQQAKALGMVDRIASLETVLDQLGVSREQMAAPGHSMSATSPRAAEDDDEDWIEAEDDDEQAEEDLDDEQSEDEEDLVDAEDDEEEQAEEDDEEQSEDEDEFDAEEDDELAEDEDEEDHGSAHHRGRADRSHAPTIRAARAAGGSMSTQNTATRPRAGAERVTVAADPVAKERKRIKDIQALGAKHSASAHFVQAAIDQGMKADAFERFVNATNERSNGPVNAGPVVDMTQKEQQRYSVARAIQAAADGNWSQAGLEMEVQQELKAKLGHKTRGGNGNSVLIPTGLGTLPRNFRGVEDEVSRPRAALTAGGSTAGSELVFTEPGSFIEMLRNRMVTTAMGATFLPGLQGNVSFPKQTGAGTLTWRAENPGADVSLSDLVTGQVELTPNDATSATSFSRRLLAQGAINVEQLVRRDLAAIAALGLDAAALHGAGGNAPTGIYTQSGVNVVAFDDVITFPEVVALETAIVADNADIAAMGYVTTPQIRGAAKTTQLFTGTNGAPLWTGGVLDGEMNGYRAMASNQVSKTLGSGTDEHGLIFGAWEHLLIGEWGAMELIVDPFTLSRQGLIIVTVYLIADVAVRYPEAFAKATGLVLTAAS